MLIEPTPAVPPSRGGRLRLFVSASVPLVGLLAVVATGVLAGNADHAGTATGRTAAQAAGGAVARDERVQVAARDDAAVVRAAFPPRVLGLPVLDLARARDLRADGTVGDGLVALRGYLTARPRLRGCLGAGQPAVDAALCRRDTILTDDPAPLLAWKGGAVRWVGTRPGLHLHPQALPGVTLAPLDAALDASVGAGSTPGAGAPPDAPIRPIAAVVIGRFDDPRLVGRSSGGRDHSEAFAIERLVWADGRWQDRGIARSAPRRDDELDQREIRAIVNDRLSTGAVILSQSIVDPASLAPLQPDAREAIGVPGSVAPPVWYVRTMIRLSGPPTLFDPPDAAIRRQVAWLVIGADGSVLAMDRGG
jgi:hypothetical protein